MPDALRPYEVMIILDADLDEETIRAAVERWLTLIESNGAVRRIYDRGQFERAWLGGSGGVAHVIRGPGIELPPSPGNW